MLCNKWPPLKKIQLLKTINTYYLTQFLRSWNLERVLLRACSSRSLSELNPHVVQPLVRAAMVKTWSRLRETTSMLLTWPQCLPGCWLEASGNSLPHTHLGRSSHNRCCLPRCSVGGHYLRVWVTGGKIVGVCLGGWLPHLDYSLA